MITVEMCDRPKLDWLGFGYRWRCTRCGDQRVGQWNHREADAFKQGAQHNLDKHGPEAVAQDDALLQHLEEQLRLPPVKGLGRPTRSSNTGTGRDYPTRDPQSEPTNEPQSPTQPT